MTGSAKGRKLIEMMPRERVLTETDSPFAQINGAPLNPWDVTLAYPILGELWNCSVEHVDKQVLSNLRKLNGVKGTARGG